MEFVRTTHSVDLSVLHGFTGTLGNQRAIDNWREDESTIEAAGADAHIDGH